MDQPVRRVAVLAPMSHELVPVVEALGLVPGPGGDADPYTGSVGAVEVFALLTGIGLKAARAAAKKALGLGGIDWVVLVGVAGGVDPETAIGTLVVPELVIDRKTRQQYRPDPLPDLPAAGAIVCGSELTSDLATLEPFAGHDVRAVDMETAAVAKVCEQRGCAWSVVRAVSDIVGDPVVDEAILELAGEVGQPTIGTLERYLSEHPDRADHLRRLADAVGIASHAAARAVASAIRAWD
jgi:nucleoside phosphorylase